MPDHRLQNFPFLSQEEFAEGCVRLEKKLKGAVGFGDVGLSHEGGVVCGLVVRREVLGGICAGGDGVGVGGDEDGDSEGKVQSEEEAEDDESLPKARSKSTWKVEYHLHLSRTYQLPILYFNLYPPSQSFSSSTAPATLTQVYEILTTATSRDTLRSVGVQGAISQTDHPTLGVPYYFVHPCGTAAAMGEWRRLGESGGVDAHEDFDAEKYLAVWVGVVGGVVGFFLPSGCYGILREV
ncbi:hypothetical protein L873DRAFT_382562 [Choiromyces venosus 120613-1]|uniref:Ubiquitin-like-conjugating enzyme ATG10 n=1 Tax=Choiromyces venosus 120613-1 TaxID=1336337 RepID=A0A3N4J2K5_9PEZI|nr:hypothetical protein L873DRAFT_382562 [Choiromyces venosus 120613-1]